MELTESKNKYTDFIASLSDDMKAKVDACTSVDELESLIDDYDGELPDDLVEAVAGGKRPAELRLTDLPCWCKLKVTIQTGNGKRNTWTKAGSLVWCEVTYTGYYNRAGVRIFPSNTDKSEYVDVEGSELLFERK